MKKGGVFFTAIVLTLLGATAGDAATIYACRKKVGGTIRIVGAKTICQATETKMSWNSAGLQGPMGPPGNMALAGQECKGGKRFAGYDSQGNLICAWQLVNAPFASLDLRTYEFKGATLDSAYFTNSNLSGVDFTGAYLARTNADGANLTSANLTGAMMIEGSFTQTNFSNANLSGALLINSAFPRASFSGANLTNANLTGARLSSASHMDTAILAGVTWVGTLCPDATYSSENGTDPQSCEGHLTPAP